MRKPPRQLIVYDIRTELPPDRFAVNSRLYPFVPVFQQRDRLLREVMPILGHAAKAKHGRRHAIHAIGPGNHRPKIGNRLERLNL